MDFIYERIRNDIIYFYDNWYMGNIECMKDLHISLLDSYYEPDHFKGLTSKELRTKKRKFLIDLQNMMDKLFDCR
jgi:hypothetical protein